MKNITVAKLDLLRQQNPDLVIIDVREPDEYAEFNIGGKLVPLGQIQNFQIDELEKYKDTEIYVHCRSGKRSVTACMFLDTFGFTKTNNIEGGITAWQDFQKNKLNGNPQ